ncbi:hypothetical protein BJ508DRAFT_325005 [Ascobolus immersus RN42]|uniref:Uncharacterized protein n=1 Tax=Ascobolus immersus RN42 TaxID=1160509 RepID=A0A3N4I9U5_ASCIM|nr:hypothetical protein BJ508DRAFT_325005 [Ascobolus immersus RN42]
MTTPADESLVDCFDALRLQPLEFKRGDISDPPIPGTSPSTPFTDRILEERALCGCKTVERTYEGKPPVTGVSWCKLDFDANGKGGGTMPVCGKTLLRQDFKTNLIMPALGEAEPNESKETVEETDGSEVAPCNPFAISVVFHYALEKLAPGEDPEAKYYSVCEKGTDGYYDYEYKAEEIKAGSVEGFKVLHYITQVIGDRYDEAAHFSTTVDILLELAGHKGGNAELRKRQSFLLDYYHFLHRTARENGFLIHENCREHLSRQYPKKNNVT